MVWALTLTSSRCFRSSTPFFARLFISKQYSSTYPSIGKTVSRLSRNFRPFPFQLHAMSKASKDDVVRLEPERVLPQVKELVPDLSSDRHKGQAGKIAVIGGCREYTGAPFFAAFSALKIGADIAHVFCTQGAATVIKCYSPELIVHPYLPDTADIGVTDAQGEHNSKTGSRAACVRHAVDAVGQWLDRFDALVVGPGLGRDPLMLDTVADILFEARHRNIPLVIDADGLWLINQRLDLITGYKNAIITPNAVEFRRLTQVLNVDDSATNAAEQTALLLNGPVVVKKGKNDLITDGRFTLLCSEEGSPRRAGGQGDVLSGTIATFTAWAQRSRGFDKDELHGQSSHAGAVPPLLLAAYGGCLTTRLASKKAFGLKGRAMGAVDLMYQLGNAIDQDLASL